MDIIPESFSPSEDRRKTRMAFTWQNVVQTIILLGAIYGAFAHVQSDVRDNTTRINEHDREIGDIRTVQQRNQDENAKMLRELDSKVDRMLGRLEAKFPAPQ